MPLRWQRGINPYRNTLFRRLEAGPAATPGQIIALSRRQKQRLQADGHLDAAGEALDEHAIGEAEKLLQHPASLAEELLVSHQVAQRDGDKVDALVKALAKQADLPQEREPLALAHPVALFWFVPLPDPEAVELPAWEELGLVAAGDPDDVCWDVVLDS